MKKNVGSKDRTIRIILAIALLVLYYFKVIEGTLAIVLLMISGVLLITSLINFCPLYTVLGMNTCKVKE